MDGAIPVLVPAVVSSQSLMFLDLSTTFTSDFENLLPQERCPASIFTRNGPMESYFFLRSTRMQSPLPRVRVFLLRLHIVGTNNSRCFLIFAVPSVHPHGEVPSGFTSPSDTRSSSCAKRCLQLPQLDRKNGERRANRWLGYDRTKDILEVYSCSTLLRHISSIPPIEGCLSKNFPNSM